MTESSAENPADNIGVHQIILDVRCGHCYHFLRARAASYSAICSKLGVTAVARPCKYFLNDASGISLHSSEQREFADFMAQMPANKLLAFAALLRQERITRKQGYKHGEVVYVRLFGDDYLSNYAKARIVMANSQNVYIQGIKTKFRAQLLPASVLDAGQFSKKKASLVAQNKLLDPKFNKYSDWKPKIPKVIAEYIPPTIDDFYNILEKKRKVIDKLAKGVKPKQHKKPKLKFTIKNGVKILNMRKR